MSRFKLSSSDATKRVRAIAASLILTATFAAGAHAQHEHHGAQQQTKQKKTQTTAKKKTTPVKKEETHDQHGAQPSPTPSPTPARETNTQPAPQATPQHQHGGQHDATTPAAPNAPAGVEKSPPPAPDAAKPAVDHSAHGAASTTMVTGAGAGELMGMSGNLMGIRIGDGESHVVPMGQMGSGTAWQPASSPMYMWHKQAGAWLLMLHGEAKIGINRQGGLRGVTKFESQNWLMPMAFRRVGRGTLQLRGMFSLEPLTFSGAGSPQLFQTGEVYRGQPIRDAQHPHDLFMELSAQYTVPVGERATWYAYLGFPGEPALGPVAFMHRLSASENPTAPLSHHLHDSTHISFGVFTTGFTYRWLKVEGSLFNAKEPDDKRYGFEFNPWNSRSLRVSVAPNENWALQYSYGLLKDPEFFEPGDTHRQTASVQYNRPLARGNWATALVWGRNREQHGGETFRLNGYLIESTLNFLERNYVYTRLELVDREGDDLLTHDETHALGFGEDEHPQFRVGAFTFGAARDLWNTERLSMALGGDLTFYSKPDILDGVYGRSPTSFKIFFRIRPGKMSHEGGGASHVGHGSN